MRPLARRSAPLLFLPLLLLAVTYCSGDDGGPSEPDETGSIRATVTGDGDELAGVLVRLFPNGGASAQTTATTGASGQVTFANLDPGAYDVDVVVPAGFELASGQTARRDVTVAADEQATVAFGLEEIVVPPTEGQIRARVLDGAAAVSGVEVSLFATGGVTALETLTTGADGRVLFTGLGAGGFDVGIELPPDYEVAPGDTTRKAVTVTLGQTTDVLFGVNAPQATVVEIQVGGTSFSPANVTIAPGTTVRWVWNNGSHTVTPTGHSEWTSTALNATTQTFEHTFNVNGTFNYHCIPHQSLGMDGVITVQ